MVQLLVLIKLMHLLGECFNRTPSNMWVSTQWDQSSATQQLLSISRNIRKYTMFYEWVSLTWRAWYALSTRTSAYKSVKNYRSTFLIFLIYWLCREEKHVFFKDWQRKKHIVCICKPSRMDILIYCGSPPLICVILVKLWHQWRFQMFVSGDLLTYGILNDVCVVPTSVMESKI